MVDANRACLRLQRGLDLGLRVDLDQRLHAQAAHELEQHAEAL